MRTSGLAALLLSTALFQLGGGLIGTLTPLRGEAEGFSEIALGALGAAYFAAFIAGCFMGPYLIERVGHIRAFAVGAAAAAVSVILQPAWLWPLAWFLCRGIAGFSIAILSMTLESWLNDRATNQTRGRILSLYIVATWSALLCGQWLLLLADPRSYELFSIGAALYCLCLMPMGVTRLPAPAPHAALRPNLRRIFTLSPVGAAGCLTVGLANGAFWTLAPLYAQALGFNTAGLALFMSVFIAGGALAQWPVGRISDGVDRRAVIALIAAGASVCGLVLGAEGGHLLGNSPVLFFSVVFTLGGFMLPLYSLSIAHANDRLPREEFVEASAALLIITSATSVPGPLLAAWAMAARGPAALFVVMGVTHGAMAVFAFTRMLVREATSEDMREKFNATLQGSPAALALDPRGPVKDKSP